MTIKPLAVVSAFLLLSTCAPSVTAPPRPPLTPTDIQAAVGAISSQDKTTRTLFSMGHIHVNGRQGELEANLVIAAAKNPDRIKIEITHPWGRPLVHILMDTSGLRVLSFTEKRLYMGQPGDPVLPGVLDIPVKREVLWSIIRAYPVLPPYHQVVSEAGSRLVFLTREGEKAAVMHMDPEGFIPQSIIFPAQETGVVYKDFQTEKETIFARETVVGDKEGNTLTIDLKAMAFNEPIPKAIFTLRVPADFTKMRFSDERKVP
ncbi:MAG: hypothetical protein U5R49_08825 [Deltaproteobacteria bacterium]|nr:hypothetical protein [Deltaproteobacteria bacterium]